MPNGDSKRTDVADESDVATIANRSSELPGPLTSAFVLVVTHGADVNATFSIDPSSPSARLLGQSPTCDVRISDPEVSRRHASLDASEAGLRVCDLGSTNGTFVNGTRIGTAFLRGGETLRVGTTSFRVDAVKRPAARGAELSSFGPMLGASREMRRLYPLCERLGKSDVPVIIEGETGTGKEVVAEAIHQASARRTGPFIVFDCTAVPPSLVESALFGHERGAFTGALTTRKGVFEQADGGTLLIDEIGDLEIGLQPKLLRAIQRSEVQRVGGEKWLKMNVRVLAATRRDLDKEVAAGRFRDDLFFRLAVARVELPPLRRRQGDVALLAGHFWERMGGAEHGIPAELLARFEASSWPGNVRELENAVARYLALGDLAYADAPASTLTVPLPSDDDSPGPDVAAIIENVLALDLPFSKAKQRVNDAFERTYVDRAVARHDGNIARAAAASGIALRYFQLIRARRGKPRGT